MNELKLTSTVEATFRLCLQYGANKHSSWVPKITESSGSGGLANNLRCAVATLASCTLVKITVPYRVAWNVKLQEAMYFNGD